MPVYVFSGAETSKRSAFPRCITLDVIAQNTRALEWYIAHIATVFDFVLVIFFIGDYALRLFFVSHFLVIQQRCRESFGELQWVIEADRRQLKAFVFS